MPDKWSRWLCHFYDTGGKDSLQPPSWIEGSYAGKRGITHCPQRYAYKTLLTPCKNALFFVLSFVKKWQHCEMLHEQFNATVFLHLVLTDGIWIDTVCRSALFSEVHFSPGTDWVVWVSWQTIQQRSSSSLFCRRPLWAVLAWAGMSILALPAHSTRIVCRESMIKKKFCPSIAGLAEVGMDVAGPGAFLCVCAHVRACACVCACVFLLHVASQMIGQILQ